MDHHRQAYSAQTPSSRQMRYAPQSHDQQRDINSMYSVKPDSYQQLASPTWQTPVAGAQGSMSQSRGMSSTGNGDNDGDVSMEDADPYNRHKYSSQAAQQRLSQQYTPSLTESVAARRYSPMNMSPTSPSATGTPSGQNSFTSYTPQSQSSRHSPSKGYSYTSSAHNYYPPNGASLATSRVARKSC